MSSDPSRRHPGPWRRTLGCLGSLVLLGLGVLLGLFVPETLRRAVLSRLPPALTRFAPTASAPSSSSTTTLATSTPPPRPATTAATPEPLPTPTPTPTPPSRPLPENPVLPKSRDAVRLYNGIQLRTSFETEPGGLASYERETPADYAIDLRLQVKVPVAARTVADLTKTNPALPNVLPKLPTLLEKAEVSKFYHGVYQLKTELLQRTLTRLDGIMPPDTFYDTETVLEFQDPDSKRKTLLIQTRMEVDADGSDADRLNVFDDADDVHFQPLTSYRWPRRNPAAGPSVYLAPLQARLTKLQSDTRNVTGTGAGAAANRRENAAAVEDLKLTINQLTRHSSLIGRTDPFIVLPGFIANAKGHPYQPKLGDYAVVVAGNTVYPAIFGDVGPAYKLGEASLRIARAVDPAANANHSPVDDLKITYLVFPGTADGPPGPPDLGKIHARCQALLTEIGGLGLGATLREWENLIPPAPTPTPTPTPTPSPSVSPSASPSPTASPGASSSPSPSSPSSPTGTSSLTPNPSPAASASAKPSPSLVPGVLATPSPTPLNRLPSAASGSPSPTPSPSPGR